MNDPVTLTKDVYTKVLTNIKYTGRVYIVPKENNHPSEYHVRYVDTGDPAPDNDSIGIIFTESFTPDVKKYSDFYVKPVGNDGKVLIIE